MNIKKIVCTVTAAIMGLSGMSFSTGYAAENKDSVLILGDSIGSGYKASQGFGSIVADYLSADYNNLARNGTKTSDLLDSVKNNSETRDSVKKSNRIFISIGGNDYLSILNSVINEYKSEGDSLQDIKDKMMADSLNVISKLSVLSDVTVPATANINNTISQIKTINPDCEITVLALYNPFDGISISDQSLNMINSFAAPIINTFNNKLKLMNGIKIAPVYEYFKGNIYAYTNMKDSDVHPNDAGHIKIAAAILSNITGENVNTVLGKILGKLTPQQLAALPSQLKDGIEIIEPQVTTAAPATTTTTSASATTAASTSINPSSSVVSTTTQVPVATSVTAASAAQSALPADTSITSVSTTVSSKISSSATALKTTTKTTVKQSPSTSDNGVSGAVIFIGLLSTAAIVFTASRKKENK